MGVIELKAQIKSGKLNDLYIFCGEEWGVQKLYIDFMTQIIGKRLYIDTIDDIYNQLTTSRIIKSSCLYVVRDDKAIISNEKLQNQLLNGVIGNNVLVLIVTQLDKRTKFFTTFKDKIITFDKMTLQTLKKYVKRDLSITDESAKRLIELCEYDYGRIQLEEDKIRQYADKMQITNYDDVIQLFEADGVISTPAQDAVFDLVDAIACRDVDAVYSLYEDCKKIGESSLVILSVLFNTIKQILQVQSYEGNNIESATGLNSWQVKTLRNKCGYYGNMELVNILKLIHELECGVKVGKYDDPILIDYLLANIL